MTKYFVEIQDIEDFDYILMESPMFDTEIKAIEWFNKLEWFDRDRLTACVMSCEVNDEGDIEGGILFCEDLTGVIRNEEV